ncbi:MAG: hypothetical protein WD115_02190 [Balneolaceae bacterium]
MQPNPLLRGFLYLMILLWSMPLAAQETRGGEDALLPEIDPQDIEIRSQYSARFPGLDRQPILGFTPGSRVFQTNPDRVPFMEDREERAAQLPVGELGRPDPPDYAFFPYTPSRRGYARIGAGSFLSPSADLWISEEVSNQQFLTAELDYLSGNGHLDQASSFRQFDFRGGYTGRASERSLLEVWLSGLSDFNHLILPAGAPTDTDPGKKTVSHFQAGTALQYYRSRTDYLDLRLDATLGTIELIDEQGPHADQLREWDTSLAAHYIWAGGQLEETWRVGGEIQAGGYQSDRIAGASNWSIVGLNGRYQRLINYQTQVSAELGGDLVSDPIGPVRVHFSPMVNVEHSFSDLLGMSAWLDGDTNLQRHRDLHQSNRFLATGEHVVARYDLETGGQILLEPLPSNQIRIGALYRSSKDHRWFEQDPAGGVPAVYRVRYDDVTVSRAFAGLSVDLMQERIWFDVEGYLQNSRITDQQKLPFAEEYGLNGAVTIQPVSLVHFEFWGDFRGPRALPGGGTLAAFLNLGTRLELRLGDSFGIYGEMNNLLNQEFEIWQGYEERPMQVYGGVTMHF